MFVAAAVALVQAVPAIEFATLGDGPLVAEYRAAWPDELAARRERGNAPDFRPPSRFARVGAEVFRRGGRTVPALLALLRAEATAPLPDPDDTHDLLAWHVLEVLVAVGDPRAVPAALQVADGLGCVDELTRAGWQ